jgi:integrase
VPRAATGTVEERRDEEGALVAYRIRFRAHRQRVSVTLPVREGWTAERAEQRLADSLAAVRLGVWQAPERRRSRSEPEAQRGPVTVGDLLHELYADAGAEVAVGDKAERTLADLAWRIDRWLGPRLGPVPVAELDVAAVDRFRREVYTAGLGPSSVNKLLGTLASALDVAEDRGQLGGPNPARVGGKRRRMRVPARERSYLDGPQAIAALLDAAGALDAEARPDRGNTGRRAWVATLTFGGLRLQESADLRWRSVDLAAGTLTVEAAKTAAGVRVVPLLPALRDELAAHRAALDEVAPDALVFGLAPGERTARPGSRTLAGNLRRRTFDAATERASAALVAAGRPPLPDLTPHALRRTCASLLFALGVELPDVMDRMGWASPGVCLGIYARTMRRDAAERERLRGLAEGTVPASEWSRMVPNGPATTPLPANGGDEGSPESAD